MSTPTTPQQNGSKSFLFVSCSNPDLNESKREQDLDQLESTRKSVTSSQMHDTELTTEQIENVLDGVQLPTNLVFIPKETHRSRSTIVDKVPSSIKRSFIDQGEESYIISTKKMKEDHSFSSTSQLSIPLCHPSFTAPTSADSMGSSFNAKKGKCVSFGRWTKEEHQAFLQGLKVYGREWKKVAQNIPTRSSAQIRSHAQKYFAKMAKDEQLRQEEAQQCHDSKLAQDPTSSALVQREANADPSFDIRHLTPSVLLRVDRILEDPHGAQIEVEDTLRLLKERYLELQKKLYEHQLKKNDEEHQISASAFDLYSSISKSSDRSPFLSQSSPIRISAESIALHKKELIALDVLGGELYRSGSKENLVSATQENTILKNAPQQHSDTQSNGSA